MKRIFLISLALTIAPTLAQAQGHGNEEAQTPNPDDVYVSAKLNEDAKAVVAGMNHFGADLYAHVAAEAGDLAISSASISAAFGLAHAGAKGQTAQEVATTLHYPTKVVDFHKSNGEVLATMQLSATGRTMNVSNAIWLQEGFPVLDSYLALTKAHYDAGLRFVDYAKDADAARVTINRWVESKTNDKIKELLVSEDVKNTTKSILVNTVYFKADWDAPFWKGATKDDKFSLASGQDIMRPLMHQRGQFTYAEIGGVKALSMPYRGGEMEMIFLLPAKADELTKLEKSLDVQAIDKWMVRLHKESQQDTIVTIPKFKIEKRFDLTGNLKALGMQVPFSDGADFSAIKFVDNYSLNENDKGIKIAKVIHKVFVEVEEKGTEAAAATAIIMEVIVTGARHQKPPPPPKIFRADHPFIFLIRDQRTGLISFMGRFTGEGASAE